MVHAVHVGLPRAGLRDVEGNGEPVQVRSDHYSWRRRRTLIEQARVDWPQDWGACCRGWLHCSWAWGWGQAREQPHQLTNKLFPQPADPSPLFHTQRTPCTSKYPRKHGRPVRSQQCCREEMGLGVHPEAEGFPVQGAGRPGLMFPTNTKTQGKCCFCHREKMF